MDWQFPPRGPSRPFPERKPLKVKWHLQHCGVYLPASQLFSLWTSSAPPVIEYILRRFPFPPQYCVYKPASFLELTNAYILSFFMDYKCLFSWLIVAWFICILEIKTDWNCFFSAFCLLFITIFKYINGIYIMHFLLNRTFCWLFGIKNIWFHKQIRLLPCWLSTILFSLHYLQLNCGNKIMHLNALSHFFHRYWYRSNHLCGREYLFQHQCTVFLFCSYLEVLLLMY